MNEVQKHERYVVGLMSGTSVDGIDAAVVRINSGAGDKPSAELIAFQNTPFPEKARAQIFELFDPSKATVDKIGRMNMWLGELYAKAALEVIALAGLKPEDISVIGSHGQTIHHAPEQHLVDGYNLHYTFQIGEGAVIASRTGIPSVTDFRVADMAVGGQGAPLVPFTEYLLFREEQRTLLLQNIGGIGNVTVIPAGCKPEDVYAFDTGPGNMIIDGIVTRLYPGEKTMDVGGELAAQGQVNSDLLTLLKADEYYVQPLPKSTGRERFGSEYVDKLISYQASHQLSNVDLIATVTMLTAWSIADAYARYIKEHNIAHALIVGGGGSYNPVLMSYLREQMAELGVEVLTQEDIGQSSDAKEAVAFGLLADYTLARSANNLPRVTGAHRPIVMGKISY